MGFFQLIWSGIQWVFGLILPVFAKAKDVRALGRKLRWVIHFTLLALILVGLGFLNYAFDLERLLEAPLPILRKLWLPLLFFIVYLLSWLGWWLWVLLAAAEERSDHPDIDVAWEQAVASLRQNGIDVAAVPLFLVLGQPEGSEDALFAGAQIEYTVQGEPKIADSPLHVYASPDGIFVTCAGASLLGREAQALREADEEASRAAVVQEQRAPSVGAGDSVRIEDQSSLNVPSGGESVSTAAAAPGSSMQMTMESQLLVADRPAQPRKPPARVPLLKNAIEVERLTIRLKHLCWLILQERRPYCPLNGILLLIPHAASDSDTEANQIGLICQRDLASIREVLQINCPVFALVCDLESAQGFKEFVDRFPRGHRQRRLGQQFPYVADLRPAAAATLIDSGVQWICQDLFPPLVYRLMRLEKSAQDKMAPVLRGNVNLFHLLFQVRERRKRLGRILSLAVTLEDPEPVLFGGCYLAATGRSTREQAFIAAVFHRLLENQNFVTWTRTARAEESDYRRWVRFGYTALATFVLGFLVMGYTLLRR